MTNAPNHEVGCANRNDCPKPLFHHNRHTKHYWKLILSISAVIFFSLWNLFLPAQANFVSNEKSGYFSTTQKISNISMHYPSLPSTFSSTSNSDIFLSSDTANAKEEEYPRVYIVPIPSEFNKDLLDCSIQLKKKSQKNLPNAWYAKVEDYQRFKEINPKEPFGKPTLSSTTTCRNNNTTTNTSCFTHHHMATAQHPHFDGGEYDFEVYFHTMMEGYFNLVDKAEDADLFYLPIYVGRQACHPKGPDHFDDGIYHLVEWYMQHYPPRQKEKNRSKFTTINITNQSKTDFFTVTGRVCSCNKDTECNPIKKVHNAERLTTRLRMIAWERFSPENDTNKGNLVVPYPTQIHEMSNWSIKERRPILVLGILGKKRKSCVVCGPCNNAWSFEATKDQCLPQCVNIRDELIEGMRLHTTSADVSRSNSTSTQKKRKTKIKKDVVLWTSTNNPSTEWFPTDDDAGRKANFWPPKQATEKMMFATFCLQPAGDTLSRKSFFESLQVGCIPVVFREDDAYLEQLPFSNIIPYREIFYYIPESCVLDARTCSILDSTSVLANNTTNSGTVNDFVDVLRQVSKKTIHQRRRLIHQYGRMWMYSSHDGKAGGYNDVHNPDAFLTALRETWKLSLSS